MGVKGYRKDGIREPQNRILICPYFQVLGPNIGNEGRNGYVNKNSFGDSILENKRQMVSYRILVKETNRYRKPLNYKLIRIIRYNRKFRILAILLQ